LPFQSNQSGIETKSDKQYLIGFLTSNRTKVELKHCFILSSNAFKRSLPIEPKWNWNSWTDKDPALTVTLPIEPKWNWNKSCYQLLINEFGFQSNQSGIETLTKLNIHKFQMSSNRTKVELKLDTSRLNPVIRVFQSNQSGIETFGVSLIIAAPADFQSNQSGIETEFH